MHSLDWLIILVEYWPRYPWFCLSCTHLKQNSNKIAKWDTKAHLLVQLVSVLRDNWRKHLQPHFRERLNNCYSEIMLKISECFSFEALDFSLQLLCMWVIIMLGGFNFLKCLLTSLISEITTRGNIARWLCVPWELDNRYLWPSWSLGTKKQILKTSKSPVWQSLLAFSWK